MQKYICLFAFLLLQSCLDPSLFSPPPPTKAPGLYGLTGWNGQVAYKTGDSWIASAIDVNGQVGYPLTVYPPTAECIPKTSVKWSASSELVSGKFPPGIGFKQGEHTITGIPTERGHWITTMKVWDVNCNGNFYLGFTQEIRFHITGSGVVKD